MRLIESWRGSFEQACDPELLQSTRARAVPLAKANMSLFVIIGGPGTGKTTVLAELARRGYRCVAEDARAVIREQMESGGSALPWADASRYAELLLKRSIDTYQSLVLNSSVSSAPIFFDRGIGDVLAYAEMIGHALPAELHARVRGMRYAGPIFLAPWWPEIYVTDGERRQSREEAERTEHAIAGMYRALGYRVVRLPLVSPAERAEFILAAVQSA